MNADSTILMGGCLCGAIRYRAEGPPKRVTNCHCETCRRSNGAAFVTAASFDPERFAFTKGEPSFYASSAAARRSFCPTCGAALAFHYNDGEAVAIWVASFDDPNALPPQRNIWLDSKLSWTPIDEALPGFPRGATRPAGANG